MKDKQDNKIKSLSEYIVAAEKEIQLGNNVKENMKKIEDIMSTLSFDEMLQIDDYILTQNLLKK